MKNQEILNREALYKSIPNKYVDIAVGASAAKANLKTLGGSSNIDVTGQFVRLRAQTGDITFLRGDYVSTLAAGAGIVLTEAEEEEFFVDPEGEIELTHISDGASKVLRVFYSIG